MFLWEQAYMKAKAASLLVRKHFDHNSKIYLGGFKDKSNVNFMQTGNKIQRENAQDSKDKELELRNQRCLILPNNKYKKVWDVLIIVLLIYTAIYIPYKVCFLDTTSDFQFIFDLVVDSCFLTDIVFNFMTV